MYVCVLYICPEPPLKLPHGALTNIKCTIEMLMEMVYVRTMVTQMEDNVENYTWQEMEGEGKMAVKSI